MARIRVNTAPIPTSARPLDFKRKLPSRVRRGAFLRTFGNGNAASAQHVRGSGEEQIAQERDRVGQLEHVVPSEIDESKVPIQFARSIAGDRKGLVQEEVAQEAGGV